MAVSIIVDKNIPFVQGVLEEFAQVRYLSSEEITPESVRDADALMVRTRTRCDSALLEGARCRFIATATIGTDHIDLDYCRRRNIVVANAPGCNAPAVAQYVFASLVRLLGPKLSGLTMGIVGVGHVGGLVLDWARRFGLRVLPCDPPRAEREGTAGFADLRSIALEADIVTFHTPLTYDGAYPTFHLCGEEFLAAVKRSPVIVNSARGAVLDTPAVIAALESGKISAAVVDCWENEPRIDPRLVEKAAIATPHIAGYSFQGKARATAMVLEALASHFGFEGLKPVENYPLDASKGVSLEQVVSSYDPMADSARLKADPLGFETLRNGYSLRMEAGEE